jgi:hypothetical protein
MSVRQLAHTQLEVMRMILTRVPRWGEAGQPGSGYHRKEMTMATARMLLVTGAVAMLSAAPVFAQTNTETGSTGPHDNTVTTPNGTMPTNAAGASGAMSTAPRHNMGSSSMHSSMHGRSTSGTSAMRGGRGDAQNAAVDQLNEQSYQAAQKACRVALACLAVQA